MPTGTQKARMRPLSRQMNSSHANLDKAANGVCFEVPIQALCDDNSTIGLPILKILNEPFARELHKLEAAHFRSE